VVAARQDSGSPDGVHSSSRPDRSKRCLTGRAAVSRLLAATDDDALAEVESLIGDAFGEVAGMMLALGIVFLLVQAAIRFVPRPARPLAQLAGLGVMALATLVVVT
jgi:hypothetical protein